MRVRVTVKEHLAMRGWSIAKFARKADLDYKTVHKLVVDPYADVTLYTVGRIAETFGVSIKDMVEDG